MHNKRMSPDTAAPDEHTRKSMIGERLYPPIAPRRPDLASKTTGMPLEVDNSELRRRCCFAHLALS